MLPIDLFLLPSQVPPDSLAGRSAIAIDVLRAGTTITTALAAGASMVIPCASVEAARQRASETRQALLGGERQGLMIAGFDLSNSPESYRPGLVRGRPVVFTSTNGTLAIRTCQQADQVLVGSFVNLAAVCRRLLDRSQPVTIVCAGTDGVPTLEDTLFGGAVCRRLGQTTGIRMNPAARSASELWNTAERQMRTGKSLGEILAGSQGGKNLLRLGLRADIEFAARIDHFAEVPVLDGKTGTLRFDVDLDGTGG